MKGLDIIRGIDRDLFGKGMVITTSFGYKGNQIMMGFGLCYSDLLLLTEFSNDVLRVYFMVPTYPCGLCRQG
jgi:hypothetical protein